ncbi:FAD-binding oxidoreductase [Streptomyces violaceorubidus]|uniref:FAD-binding oxidoreductase n=1 Tax=Streptomyces violaceorubidus TaxID=284042 RepID=UPI0004BFC82F|nr:FAD-binding oxidoreductase [Streptomyces violaceorubidus]
MNPSDSTTGRPDRSHALSALRNAVSGAVLTPDDPAYEAECTGHNLLHVARPAVVVGAVAVEDVVAAVRFARSQDMPVAVRNAGHQTVLPEGPGEWLLITTGRMDDVCVDPRARTATVGAGARWRKVVDASAKHGLAPLAGSAPGVGVLGYTLGGGIGPLLSRSHGYAADHVRRMDMVTADGEVLRVTPQSDPELFWALLGCKGNFGVVVSMEFALFPVTRFYGGGLYFRGEDTAQVLAVWREWLTTLDEDTTTSVAVQRLPEVPDLPDVLRGSFVLHVRVGHQGPASRGEVLVAPLRRAAVCLLDTLAERPVTEVGEIHVDPVRPAPVSGTSVGLREFSAATAEAFTALTDADSGCPLASVEIRALGGALDRQPPVPNAVPSRGLPFVSFAFGVAEGERAEPAQKYLAAYAEGMSPWADRRDIVNFLSPESAFDEAEMRRVFGEERYTRLAAVKRRLDPGNVFRLNHNVLPG